MLIRKKLFYISIACSILGVAAVIYFIYAVITIFQALDTSQIPLSRQSELDETANWKTYTHKAYKFEFKYPPVFREKQQTVTLDYDGINLASLFTAKNQYGLEANSLDINVYPSLKEYRLVDNAGGFNFYFDANNRRWLHYKINESSEFVPKIAHSFVEAYIYKTGDVKCSKELILIPDPLYKYLVEIVNGLCRNDEGINLEGYYDLSSTEILSTFKFVK